MEIFGIKLRVLAREKCEPNRPTGMTGHGHPHHVHGALPD